MAFFLTLLYVAFIFLRPQEWIEDIKGWPILDVMAVASISWAFLEGEFSADKWRRSPINRMVLGLWGALVLSHLAHLSFWGMRLAIQEFAKVAIVYFLIIFTVHTFPRLKAFTWTLVAMATFLALQSVLQYYGEGIVGVDVLRRTETIIQTRGIGIFQDPNDLALNIVCFVPFVLPSFHKYFLSRTWFTGMLFLIPMVTGIVFTRSRGGILGLAGVLWFYFYKRVGPLLSIGALAILLSIVMALPRMESVSPTQGTARTRMEHWAYGFDLFKGNPLFGVGMGMFTENYSHTAHNSFILVLAEAGFVGAFFWVALFLAGFRELFLLGRLPQAPPWLEPLLNSLTGALVGWQICGFFLSQTYKFTSFILLALVVATMNVLSREGYVVEHPWGMRMMIWSFLGTVGAIIFMHLALMILWRMAVGG